jgi:hypothetical protein
VRLPRWADAGTAQQPYVPKYQIAMKQRDFPMSLSGDWLILLFFKTNMPMIRPMPSSSMVDPKMDAPDLEDSPDWKDGLLQDPGV